VVACGGVFALLTYYYYYVFFLVYLMPVITIMRATLPVVHPHTDAIASEAS
jgi:hypothetical protein